MNIKLMLAMAQLGTPLAQLVNSPDKDTYTALYNPDGPNGIDWNTYPAGQAIDANRSSMRTIPTIMTLFVILLNYPHTFRYHQQG